jgi:hypothetical protein
MKRLVLIGEGHGEVSALPILANKILQQKNAQGQMFADDEIVRAGNPKGLVKWKKEASQTDFEEWLKYVRYAARRPNLGGVLAVFDGDAKKFPAGKDDPFCAVTAAITMAEAATKIGAGRDFSIAVVFACVEFETWIIASTESLAGKSFEDGRPVLPHNTAFPEGHPESHGKRWLEKNCPNYRPRRDQAPLTRLIDLQLVRTRQLRSFSRLDNAIGQILSAVNTGSHIASPLPQ